MDSNYKPICRISRQSRDVFDLLQRVSMALRSNGEDNYADTMEHEVIDKAGEYDKALEICGKYVSIRYINDRKVKKK